MVMVDDPATPVPPTAEPPEVMMKFVLLAPAAAPRFLPDKSSVPPAVRFRVLTVTDVAPVVFEVRTMLGTTAAP